MEISRANMKEILATYLSKREKLEKKGILEEKKGDNISLSGEGYVFLKALENLKKMPQFREEMVKELKEKILAGEYSIEGESIARNMVKVLLAEDMNDLS